MTVQVQVKVMLLQDGQEVIHDLHIIGNGVMKWEHWVMLHGDFPDNIGILVPFFHCFYNPGVLGVPPCHPSWITTSNLSKSD